MRTAGSVLTLLTGAASASWWHPSPPPAQAATPCPGGAEFKYEQVWSSGFRAVVTMSRWIPGRRVVVHFDEGELPGLRSYGAELLDTTATTATFSLGSTPGKSAADSFDLQGRGKPPKASAVRISCELPYPPPPPTPSKPPAPVDGCAEYAHTLEVTEEWEGGYTMQVTLSSSLPHSIAPNLEVGLNFSVVTLGKEPAKAAGTGVVSMERSNRRASLAPSPPSPMSAAATAVSTGKVVMRLQELRGAQLVAESRKRGVISVLVTPSETFNGGSSDGSADATDARRSSTTYRFDMDVLASHERPPRITCSERWPSPQPYIPPLPPISPPAPSPEPPLVPAPPCPPSPSPPPYPIFQCGAPESRYSFDAMEAGSSTSNVLEAAPLLQLSSEQNMPEIGVYTASVHRLPGTNWPAAEHGLLTIRFAVEESTGEIMDVRGGTLSVPRNEEQIGNPTKELVFELRDSLRREELHFSKSQTLVLQFVGTGRLPTVNSITCDNSPATSRDVAYVESPTAVLLHMCTATSAHLCCGAQRIAQLRSSGAAGSQPMTAAPWCVDALALGRSCRDYAESAASCEAHYERAGVPCVFSREGCNAEQSGICEEPSPPTPPPAAPPPLPGCPASLGVQYRVSSSKPGMFTVSVKVENTQRKIVLSLSFGVNLTVSNVWGAQVYQEDLVIKDPSEVSTATVPRTTSISYTFESGFVSFVSETGKSGLLKFFGFTVSNFPEHFDPEDRRPTLSCEGKFPPNPPLPPHPPTPPRPPPSPHPPPPPCPFPPPPPPPEPWPPPGMPPPPPSPSPPPSPEPPWPPPPPSPPAPKLPPPPQCPPSRPTPARPPPLQPPPPPPMPPMSPPLKAAAPFDIEIVEVSCDILALSWKELQHEVNLQADSVAVEWSIVGSESTTSGGREAGLTTREEFPFYSPPPPSSPPPEPSRPPPPLPPILPSPPFVPPPMLPLPSVPPFAPPFAPPLCPPPPPRSPFRVASEPSAWEGTYEGIATSSDAHVKVTLRAGKGDIIWDGEDEWERLEEAVRTEDSTRIPSMNSADRNKMVGAREKAVTVSAHSHTSSAMSKIKVSTSRDSSRTVTQGRPVVRHLSPFFSQDSQPSQDFETPALFVRATNPKYNHSVYSLSNHSMQTELRTVATEIAEGQPGDSDSVLAHSLRLANLPPGFQIKYRLQARNVAGWGAWSAWMQAETPPASRRPAALEAPSVLRFSESCDAVTFQLPRRRNGCDGDGHMALELQPSGASSWLSVRQKLQPASTTEFDGLDPIGVYHFRLRAYNSAGPGPDGSQLLIRPCVFTSPPPLSVPPVLSPSQPPSPSPRNPPWFPPSPSPSISPPPLPCLQLPPQQPAPLTPCYSPSLLLPQPMPSLPRPLPPPPPQQHHPALIQALSPDLPPSSPTTPHPSTMGKSSALSTSSIVSPKREETLSIHMPSAPAPPLPHQRNEPASVVSPTLQKPFSFYMPSAPTPPSPQHRNSPTILALQPPPVSSLLYSSRTHMDHASRQPDHEKTKTKEVPAHYHEQASKAIEARESRTNEVLTTEIKRDVKQEADASRTNEVLPTETLRDVKRDTIQEYLSDRAELPPWLVALLAGYFVNANQAILVAVVTMLFVVLIICMFACRKCGRAKSLHGYRAVGSSVAPKVCDYDSDEGTTTYECNRISHKETVKPNGKASSTTKQQYGLTSDHKNAYARNASSNIFEDGPACEWDDTAKHRRDDEPPCNWSDTHDDEQHDGVSFSHHQLRHEHHMVVSL